MGAANFVCSTKASTAQEAYNELVRQAQYDHGHSGYSGTIAETGGFCTFQIPAGFKSIEDAAWECTGDPDDLEDLPEGVDKNEVARIRQSVDDKWGSCGCFVSDGGSTFTFFGWASD